MKKILVVGFGAMGCRHVQSLLAHPEEYEIHVVEPSVENIRINCEKIGAQREALNWHNNLNDILFSPDLAIVATSSGPRYNIVKSLLKNGVQFFLLEKIVFQSVQQFDEIIGLMNQTKAKGYCNFVNRYFNGYNQIKNNLSKDLQLRMIVHGGEFGLGCNSIHYIDIFQYLTNTIKNIQINNYELLLADTESRRGKEYREFTGIIHINNKKGDVLIIISEKGLSGGVTINVQIGKNEYVLNEQTQKMFHVWKDKIRVSEFVILPTSKLTHTIVQEIISGNCRLTQIEETVSAHAALFQCFNEVVYKKTAAEYLCPIT